MAAVTGGHGRPKNHESSSPSPRKAQLDRREIPEPELTAVPDGRGVLVNAAPADFRSGVDDLIKVEAIYPGWLELLLTTPIAGLENYEQMIRELTENRDAIKVYVEVSANGDNDS